MAAEHACKAGYRNHILAVLPTAEIELLRPHLSRMTMVAGQVLHEANSPIADVFFIESGVISSQRILVTWVGLRSACLGEKDLRERPCSSTQTRGQFIEPSPRFRAKYVE